MTRKTCPITVRTAPEGVEGVYNAGYPSDLAGFP